MRSMQALRQHAALATRRANQPTERLFDGVARSTSIVQRWAKVMGYAAGGTGFTVRLVMADGSIDTVDKTVGAITYPALSGYQRGRSLADCLPPVEIGEFIELRDAAPPETVVGPTQFDYWAAMEFILYGC